MRHVLRTSVIGLSIVLIASASLFAQAAAPSASDFYLQYRKAFDAAKKIEDVLPFMSAETTKQIQATPPAERGQMFEMIKMMGALTNVKIAKETRTATGATLTVNALDSDKQKTTGTIDIVKENGAWKLGKESWSNK
jgi:Protein of unknown function (DUF3828)